MDLPQGYEANIVPRSSTFGRYGVIQTNSYGVIDSLIAEMKMFGDSSICNARYFYPKEQEFASLESTKR
jgi:hypothetical protein